MIVFLVMVWAVLFTGVRLFFLLLSTFAYYVVVFSILTRIVRFSDIPIPPLLFFKTPYLDVFTKTPHSN